MVSVGRSGGRHGPRRRSIGVRASILAATLVPVLGVVVLAVLSVQTAEDVRRDTVAAADAIEEAVLVTQVDVTARVELSVYQAWLAGQRWTLDDGASPFGDVGAPLTEQVQAVTRSAQAALRSRPDLHTRVGGPGIDEAFADVRSAFERGDAAAVGAGVTRIRDELLVSLALPADPATLAGAELVRFRAMSAAGRHLVDEGALLTEALIAGSLGPNGRTELGIAIDRTDRSLEALEQIVSPSSEPALRAVAEGVATGDWGAARTAARALPDASGGPSIGDLAALLGLVDGGTELTDALTDLGDSLGGERLAQLAVERDRAETRRNVVLGVAAAACVASVLFAARFGGRLSRRLRLLHRITDRVRQGDLDAPPESVPRAHDDEIDDLADLVDELRTTIGMTLAAVDALAEGQADGPVLDSQLPGAAGADLTNGIQRLEASTSELRHRADHDALTGLLDRNGFERSLAELLAGEVRVSVFYIDLDRFKPVNDTHGHDVGDLVLQTVSRRLRALCRPIDLAGRLGGDEFILAVPVHDLDLGDRFAERVAAAISHPIAVDDRLSVRVGASVGAVVAEPRESVEMVLRRADAAMYAEKQTRRSSRAN